MSNETAPETVLVYIADHGALGPAAYMATPSGVSALDPDLGVLARVPRHQAERWEQADRLWTQCQREMEGVLSARRFQKIARIEQLAGYEAANQAADRLRRGRRV